MITHDEARNKVKSNHNKFYTEGEFTKDMLDYINQLEKKDERAKKVEKLLGLYKELSIVRFYLFLETDADLGQELMDKDEEITKQIKALEEELK